MKYGVNMGDGVRLIFFSLTVSTALVGCGSSEADKAASASPKATGAPATIASTPSGQTPVSSTNALSSAMGDVSREIAAQAQATAAQQEKTLKAQALENQKQRDFKSKENDKNRSVDKIEAVMPLLLTGVLGKTMMFLGLPDSAKCENYKSTIGTFNDVDKIYAHEQGSTTSARSPPKQPKGKTTWS